jgi:hypothetical protein
MPRPRKKDVVGIKIRLAASLVAQLEAAAKKTPGRSFNAECAMRLGRSFGEEKAFGGELGRRLMFFIANGFVIAGENYHAQQLKAPPPSNPKVSAWIKDPHTYAAAVMGAVDAMLVGQPDSTREICMLRLKSLGTTRAFWVKTGEPQ